MFTNIIEVIINFSTIQSKIRDHSKKERIKNKRILAIQ